MRRRLLPLAALAILLVVACQPNPGSVSTAPLLTGDERLTYGAWAADMDLDGDQDLIVNDHGEQPGSGLYLNDGNGGLRKHPGVFAPYPGAGRLFLDRHDCAVADVDQNGRPDIFCSTGAGQLERPKPFPYKTNELLLQKPDGSFVNRSDVYGVEGSWSRGREVGFVDANGDAFPDLITTADRRTDGNRSETVLYVNDAGRRYVDRGAAGLMKFGPIRCLETTDWNGDGFTDVALCPLNGSVRLFQATGRARFTEVTSSIGVGPTGTKTWGVAFADLDHDGWDDMVRADTSAVRVRLWNPDTERFTTGQSITEVDAQHVAVGRFDDDEELDLYVVNRGCASCTPTNPPDRIHLGVGNGTFRSFASVASTGVGDFASPWVASGTGRASFVVGNGHLEVPGPLELVTWVPPG